MRVISQAEISQLTRPELMKLLRRIGLATERGSRRKLATSRRRPKKKNGGVLWVSEDRPDVAKTAPKGPLVSIEFI